MSKCRQKILFKIGEEIVLEESTDTLIATIEQMKQILAEECEVCIDDIEVVIEDSPIDFSEDIDVTKYGMIYWKATFAIPITKVVCQLDEGSDTYLDAVNNGNLEDYLIFS